LNSSRLSTPRLFSSSTTLPRFVRWISGMFMGSSYTGKRDQQVNIRQISYLSLAVAAYLVVVGLLCVEPIAPAWARAACATLALVGAGL
jgi:hypothetical protein